MLEDKVRVLLGAIKRREGGRVEGLEGERDRRVREYIEGGKKGGGGNNIGVNVGAVFSPSSTRSAPDVLETLAGNLNALSVDDMVEPIRKAMEEERIGLLHNIGVMQAVIEHEGGRGERREGRGKPGIEELKR